MCELMLNCPEKSLCKKSRDWDNWLDWHFKIRICRIREATFCCSKWRNGPETTNNIQQAKIVEHNNQSIEA